jgi:hypothetical protein
MEIIIISELKQHSPEKLQRVIVGVAREISAGNVWIAMFSYAVPFVMKFFIQKLSLKVEIKSIGKKEHIPYNKLQ